MKHDSKSKTDKASMMPSRLDLIAEAAQRYGDRSFQNYSQVRNVAETVRDAFCKFLDESRQCVFLVPVKGPFAAQNYGSAAFSVTGKGFLPLEPISFGLAIAVSKDGDYMRVNLTCRKAGDVVFVSVERGREHRLSLPIDDVELGALIEGVYEHLMDYFQDQIDAYDNGNYGTTEIGFDIQRVDE